MDGSGIQSEPASIEVTITDVNDNPPQFTQDVYNVILNENMLGIIGTVHATDDDISPQYHEVRYKVLTSTNSLNSPIFIHHNGSVDLLNSFDFEANVSNVYYHILAYDSAGLNDSATIMVTITDMNEFPPMFSKLPNTFTIYSDTLPGSVLLNISVTDQDGGEFGVLRPIQLIQQGNVFQLRNNHQVVLLSQLDVETSISITLEVCDVGNMCSTHTVNILVITDVSNAPPFFEETEISVIIEENKVNFSIANYPANALFNLTLLGNYTGFVYSILSSTSDSFSVTNEGYLLVHDGLDYEEHTHHTVKITASNGTYVTPNPAVVTIHLINVNDNPPAIMIQGLATMIIENSLLKYPINFIHADDYDNLGVPITFLPLNDTSFHLNNDGSLYLTTALDYDKQQFHHLSISATDGELISETIMYMVEVVGENDNTPEFSQVNVSAILLENSPVNSLLLRVRAMDDDIVYPYDNGKHEIVVGYYILGDYDDTFSVEYDTDTQEGIITNDVVLDYEKIPSVIRFQVVAVDEGGQQTEIPLEG